MTKQDDIAALRAQLADMQAKLDALQAQPDKAEKWELKGGEFYVDPCGLVCRGDSIEDTRDFGVEHSIEEAALSALPYMRFHNRLLCLAAELNPSGKVGGNWAVIHDFCTGRFYADSLEIAQHSEGLFETKDAACRACDIMNKDGWKIETT